MEKSEKNRLFTITQTVSLGAIMFGVVGFFIWNFHLSRLGFVEYDIIQTRFILTGATFIILFVVISIIAAAIIYSLVCLYLKIFQKRYFKQCSFLRFLGKIDLALIVISFFLFLFCFIYFVFPSFPSWAGGGSPRLLSFIMAEEEIDNLRLFGIQKPSGSSTQTQNLCIAYESKNEVVILLEDRILELKKDYLKGSISLPSRDKLKAEADCRGLLYSYLFSWRRIMR